MLLAVVAACITATGILVTAPAAVAASSSSRGVVSVFSIVSCSQPAAGQLRVVG